MSTSYNRRSGGDGRSGSTQRANRRAPHAHTSATQRLARAPARQFSRAPIKRRPSRGGQDIHHSRFIRKADPISEEVPFVSSWSFAELPVDSELKRTVAARGYEHPTPIQDAAIPHLLMGRDVVGIANTGTGKTGAFLIPLIQKVRSARGETVLIMAPTRELAVQIDTELRALTKGMRLYSVVCVGGAGIGNQLRELRHHNEFVVGTPGRLKDLSNRGALDLSKVTTVVLDEADRMLDMGFIGDMRFLLGRTPSARQTLFFSATLSPDIERLIHEFLRDPVRISVKRGETAQNVDQDIVAIAPGEDKVDVLVRLLADHAFEKVIVFGRTKFGVEKLSHKLTARGIQAVSIHGNKEHNQRQRALQAFRDDRVRVLVATDVAARGLDIPKVSHVINFDIPTTYDDYVHRIGRTGRAGKPGIALTFVENIR